jgi:hypothetical protein
MYSISLPKNVIENNLILKKCNPVPNLNRFGERGGGSCLSI